METPNTYLVSVARALVLSEDEKQQIKTSISTLRARLNAWFGNDVKKQYQFGSSIRETILPRSVDSGSDIDYMIVFGNKDKYKPATLLNRLRRFVENKYSRGY